LNGDLRAVPGVLPAVAAAQAAGRELVVPHANADEAGLVEGAPVRCAKHLGEVVQFLRGELELPRPAAPGPHAGPANATDLSDIRGQEQAKRALAIAAAGGHHLLMVGPPGSGKSMLAERLPTLLPAMDYSAALEVAAVRSVAGLEIAAAKFYQRPFRSPHHCASSAALVGGGARPRPGEISLAHRGILFLDELPEFPRPGLEALREPIETGQVCIARANGQATFPARFQLVAAMNPCPCGYLGDRDQACGCSPQVIQSYRRRISGPLLDRFDIQIEVPRLPATLLAADRPPGVASVTVCKQVTAAHQRQLQRQGTTNVELDHQGLEQAIVLDTPSRALLTKVIERHHLSARGYVRILRVARTIADLAGQPAVDQNHIAEAVGLRCTFTANGLAKR
jgi:magnesium chelatase family protein